MSLCDPYLNNRDATVMPRPWVKWAYEPARAEDVPAAFMQAYAVAMQPPMGPVFLSIPLDDWNKPALGPAVVWTVSHRVAPDIERLRTFADRINRAQRPLLLLGPEVDRAGGWEAGIAFAEKLGAPVHGSALTDRASFPENHRLYAGPMPMTIAEVNQLVHGHDLVIVIGAQVFRYYPYVAGEYLPEGTDLLQITADPGLASVAPVGDSLIGDVRIALERLVEMIDAPKDGPAPKGLNRDRPVRASGSSEPLTADEVYATLSTVKPDDSAVVMESTSTMAELLQWLPTTRPGSFFATGSGGIGWGVPGAVGVALGDRERGIDRHVVATIGDGSFQYSIQAIWTAAQHRLPIVFVVLRNGAYAILKSFALLENTPGVPALDLPGLDIASLATGFGCRTANVDTTEELAREFKAALEADGPTVIVVPTQAELPHLG
jgi:benzoylformate decarboxylase